MRLVKPISEHEMVAHFLKTEINSRRFGKNILRLLKRDLVHREIIDAPDTKNRLENHYRRNLLGEFRGYRRNRELFENFPEDVAWYRAIISKNELALVKYINWDYWLQLSGSSRSPRDAVKNIQASIKIYGRSHTDIWKAAQALQHGVNLPEMILVSKDKHSHLVVLEGHLRLSAYFLAPEFIPDEMNVLVGYSSDLGNWNSY